MGTGYDEDGVEDLICIAPPDDGEEFFAGAISVITPVNMTLCPTYAFNLADFSIEWWFRWAEGNSMVAADVYVYGPSVREAAGGPLYLDGTSHSFGLMYENAGYGMRMRIDTVASPTVSSPWFNTPDSASGWMHVVTNVDRGGNVTTYINTTLVDTTDISGVAADSLGTCALIPPCGEEMLLDYDSWLWWDANDLTSFEDDWSAFDQIRAVHGPWAYHNRALTAAEMLESYQYRRVQNIAGVTIANYDPRKVTGQTGWDFDETHLNFGIRAACFGGLPIGIPEGATGTVTLPDQSGNGRDITLPTRTSYDNLWTIWGTRFFDGAVDVRAWCSFIADPFWR